MLSRTWYCYVCGKYIDMVRPFKLVSPSEHTDKVFIMHSKCADRADDCYLVEVKETKHD